MLSSTLSLSSENLEVGRNPLVVNLMKGVYNEKPPEPRYTDTWDPSVVLTHLDVSASAQDSLFNLAASTQDDPSSFPHLAFEMRRSSCHPAPFHQLLGRRSKVCFEPPKESPTFRPASRAVSRSLAPETRHLPSGLHAELYGPHGSA
jgi:hypothetical protein